MVSFDSPACNTFSSSEGAPHLTINREATVDLDSSNAFEGLEKLLEVWFAPSADVLPDGVKQNGLKAVLAERWKGMLDMVNCKVLSVVKSEHIDAYMLSESSMFVFPHKLILKTCGTTTLLLGLPRMLNIAATDAGFPSNTSEILDPVKVSATPYRVFYSRKNFLFPDKQYGPHRSWRKEVEYLDGMFTGGSAYMVGKMNSDHWYLYLTTPNSNLTPPQTPTSKRVATDTKILNTPAISVTQAFQNVDETLEVLMTDLDQENAEQFYMKHTSAVADSKYSERAQQAREDATNSLGALNGNCAVSSGVSGTASINSFDGQNSFDVVSKISLHHGAITPPDGVYQDEAAEGHALGTVVSETSGLSDLYPTSEYPGARVDAYLFSPCGFSANGVIPAPDGADTHYFTVHVTPEPQCSFASFETNVPGRQTGRETVDVVEKVVNIFRPGRFSITLFEAKDNSPEVCEFGEGGFVMEDVQSGKVRSAKMDVIKGYRRIDRIVHDFDGYELVFRYYEREDWQGGAPRLGEIDF